MNEHEIKLFELLLAEVFKNKIVLEELEADLFGIDIMYPTRYKTCSAISLWKRMAEFDGNKNNFEIFFKSHPYSESRASCIKNHLTTNYNKSCKN